MEISKLKELKNEIEENTEEALKNLFEIENKEIINLNNNNSGYVIYFKKKFMKEMFNLKTSVKDFMRENKQIELEAIPFNEFIIIRRKEKNDLKGGVGK